MKIAANIPKSVPWRQNCLHYQILHVSAMSVAPSVPHPLWEHSRIQAHHHSRDSYCPKASTCLSATHDSPDPPHGAPHRSPSIALAVDKVTFTPNSTREAFFPELCHRGNVTELPHDSCTRTSYNNEQALTKRVRERNTNTDPCSTSEIPGELCAPSHS